jgi:hypothetical protein
MGIQVAKGRAQMNLLPTMPNRYVAIGECSHSVNLVVTEELKIMQERALKYFKEEN